MKLKHNLLAGAVIALGFSLSTLAQNNGKFTPSRCIPKRFIYGASGCRMIFTRRPCFRNLEYASLITGKLPILQSRLTGRS